MCGKDLLVPSFPLENSGSPPHVRERLLIKKVFDAAGGITPACAGKTPRSQPPRPSRQDHPRMCGKDSASPMKILFI